VSDPACASQPRPQGRQAGSLTPRVLVPMSVQRERTLCPETDLLSNGDLCCTSPVAFRVQINIRIGVARALSREANIVITSDALTAMTLRST
jgi:hypothetical protein